MGVLLVLLALVVGCRGPSAKISPERAWDIALREAQKPELSSGYEEYLQVDPQSPQGRLAHRRIAEAEQHYRRALMLLQTGQPGAREALLRGKTIGPLPPRLNLPIARALHAQENDYLAAQFYRSFLRHLPRDPDAESAQKELSLLETELLALAMDDGAQLPTRSPWTRELLGLLGLGITLFGLLIGLLFWSLRLRRERSLEKWSEQNPELQPALTYLIGTLRHELLKHRIGAATELLSRTGSHGNPSPEQRAFLHQRLFGGTPLLAVWKEHLLSFQRVLRTEKSLPSLDRGFARADRAIRRMVRAEPAFLAGRSSALTELASSESVLASFDREMADLVRRMQRTVVDSSLLSEAAFSVRSEFRVAAIPLDDLQIVPPAESIEVAVYRTDLLLVLKNLVRNAILAVGQVEPPRRVAVDVLCDLLDTGEELVKLRVHDSSPAPIPEEKLRGSDKPLSKQRGLDLVRMTLRVYGGTLACEAGLEGYAKCVVAQLFRVLDDEGIPSSHPSYSAPKLPSLPQKES